MERRKRYQERKGISFIVVTGIDDIFILCGLEQKSVRGMNMKKTLKGSRLGVEGTEDPAKGGGWSPSTETAGWVGMAGTSLARRCKGSDSRRRFISLNFFSYICEWNLVKLLKHSLSQRYKGSHC